MKRLIAITMCFLLIGGGYAQKNTHYLHFDFGAGASNLSYNINGDANSTQKAGVTGKAGLTFNMGYSYFFSPILGLTTGIGLHSYNSSSSLDNYKSDVPRKDSEGDLQEYHVAIKNLNEKQYALLMEVPLAVQFRFKSNKKLGFLGSLGTKISFPLNSEYKPTSGTIETSGYFEQWNIEFKDLPEQGYSTYSDNNKNDLSLSPVLYATASAGGLYTISSKVDLYFGAYLDYGLGNIQKQDGKIIFDNGIYNGILSTNLPGKVSPISVGAKIGFYFKLKKAKKAIIEQPVIAPKTDLPPVFVPEKMEEKPVEVATIQEPIIPAPVVKKAVVVSKPVEVEEGIAPDSVYAKIEPEQKEVVEEAQKRAADLQTKFGDAWGKPVEIDKKYLIELSEFMKSHPKLVLRIKGHTCTLGSYKVNVKVGMRRANAIKAKLVELGVDPTQMITESRAYKEPLVPNTSKANRFKNRRVTFEILNKTK